MLRPHILASLLVVAVAMLVLPACDAAQGTTVEGRILKVDAEHGWFTMKTADSQDMKFFVDPTSRIRLTKSSAKLNEFTVGSQASVTYETRDGKNHVLSASCNPPTATDVQRKVQDALESAKNYTYAHKDEYAQKLQSALDTVNAKISSLKQQAQQVGAQAQQQLQPQIDALQRKSEAVQRQLQKVKDASPAVWNEIKTGVNAALEDLQNAFEKAKEQLK